MRITELSLRNLIKKVLLENEMQDDMLHGSHSNKTSVSRSRRTLDPKMIYDIVKKELRDTAHTPILEEIAKYSDYFEEFENNDEFLEFVDFCSKYNDEVFAGSGDWLSKEQAMQREANSKNISITDCITILVEYFS